VFRILAVSRPSREVKDGRGTCPRSKQSCNKNCCGPSYLLNDKYLETAPSALLFELQCFVNSVVSLERCETGNNRPNILILRQEKPFKNTKQQLDIRRTPKYRFDKPWSTIAGLPDPGQMRSLMLNYGSGSRRALNSSVASCFCVTSNRCDCGHPRSSRFCKGASSSRVRVWQTRR